MEPVQCTEDDALSHDNFTGQEASGTPYAHSEADAMDVETDGGQNCDNNEGQRKRHRSGEDEEMPSSQDSEDSHSPSQDSHPPSQDSHPPSQDSHPPSQDSRARQGSCPRTQTPPDSNRQTTPRRQQAPSRVRLPASYMRAGTITDRSRYPVELQRYYHPSELMVPRRRDLLSIESQSKSFSMTEVEDLQPFAGLSWSFVDEFKAGLSEELRKVLFLFDVLNGLANHHPWNGYVVPVEAVGCSDDAKLRPKLMADNKTITGVLFSELHDTDDEPERLNSMLEDDSGDLQTGTVMRSLPFLSISLGFTVAVLEIDGKEEFMQFGVVTVTGLANVDSLQFILVSRRFAPVCVCFS